MNYRAKIREAIKCPQFGDSHYGEWGALRYDQRVYIRRLLDELDHADYYVRKLYEENMKLQRRKDKTVQEIDLISKHIEEALDELRMKEALNIFDIDLDLIKESDDLFNQIHEAINEMKDDTLKDKFEVILNNNLIKTKEIKTNYRTICGCRISYDDLEKSISFIVKEDDKPTYEQLEEEIKRLKEQNEFLMKQDNILQSLMHWLYKEYDKPLKLYEIKSISDERYKTYKKVIDKIKELKEEMK